VTIEVFDGTLLWQNCFDAVRTYRFLFVLSGGCHLSVVVKQVKMAAVVLSRLSRRPTLRMESAVRLGRNPIRCHYRRTALYLRFALITLGAWRVDDARAEGSFVSTDTEERSS